MDSIFTTSSSSAVRRGRGQGETRPVYGLSIPRHGTGLEACGSASGHCARILEGGALMVKSGRPRCGDCVPLVQQETKRNLGREPAREAATAKTQAEGGEAFARRRAASRAASLSAATMMPQKPAVSAQRVAAVNLRQMFNGGPPHCSSAENLLHCKAALPLWSRTQSQRHQLHAVSQRNVPCSSSPATERALFGLSASDWHHLRLVPSCMMRMMEGWTLCCRQPVLPPHAAAPAAAPALSTQQMRTPGLQRCHYSTCWSHLSAGKHAQKKKLLH